MKASATDLHVQVWGEGGERVVLVHGSNASDPAKGWEQQRALADRYQLVVPDRRGYGKSAPMVKPDFEADVRDIIELLGEGGHLVGFSYGGVLSLLVAARRPDLLRSLTLIEPPAFDVARGDPEVEALIGRMAPLWAPDRDLTPKQFIAGFSWAIGEPVEGPVELSPEARKGVTQTMKEPPPWEAEVPLDEIASTSFPKLVASGEWHPWMETVCHVLTRRLGAERLHVPGAGHAVHHAAAEQFNPRLIALVERAV